MAAADYAVEVLADTPAGFWALDDTSGTVATDSSGNANHGTYVGSPTLAGRTIGDLVCPNFDGTDDYVSLPDLDFGTSPYTLEAVAVADIVHGGQGIILTGREGGGSWVTASIGSRIANVGYSGQLGGGGYYGNVFVGWELANDGALAADTTVHLAYTYDGTTGRLYVDGAEAATVALSAGQSSNLGWDIATNHTRGTFWDGAIAGVALYDTALSAPRIAAHYDALVAAPPVPGEDAAVSFTATATLDVTAPISAVTAAVSFTGSATLDVYALPLGLRRRLVVVDIYGTPYGELENATLGAITYRLGEPEEFAFTLPIGDPKAHLLLGERFREVQVWRGDQLLAWGPMVRPSADKSNLAISCKGALWYLSRRHIGKASRQNYILNGDFEDGTTNWRIGALSPFEPLINRDPAYWSATTPTERPLTGGHSLRLEQLDSGLPRYGVAASQYFVWSTDGVTAPEGDLFSMVARCWIPSADWRGPSPDNAMGIMIARYSTTEVVATQPEGGGPVEYLPKPIEAVKIDVTEDTPRDVWVRLEAQLLAPYTGQPEFVAVTLGCPDGVIFWDRATLTLDEGLRFYGVDQATIAKTLLEHLQDPAYGKSDLNLTADMPLTGVLRDRVFPHHEHQVGIDCINELVSLNNGFDLSINYTATTRVVRTNYPRKGSLRPQFSLALGKNVADFAWNFVGESSANSVIVLGTGDGSDREESSAWNPPAYGGLTLEVVFSAPPDTPIDSLDDLALEQLAIATGPDMLAVTTTAVTPGQPDPIGTLWPGDCVPVLLRAGALEIADCYRIVELVITPEDTLELTLNRRDP